MGAGGTEILLNLFAGLRRHVFPFKNLALLVDHHHRQRALVSIHANRFHLVLLC